MAVTLNAGRDLESTIKSLQIGCIVATLVLLKSEESQPSVELRAMEEVRRLSALTALLLLLATALHSSLPGAAAAPISCPSTNQLASSCARFVIGQNPAVPAYNGGCCKLLRSAPPSCLCNAIPSNAGSVISKNAIANIRKGCSISGINCPGIGK